MMKNISVMKALRRNQSMESSFSTNAHLYRRISAGRVKCTDSYVAGKDTGGEQASYMGLRTDKEWIQ